MDSKCEKTVLKCYKWLSLVKIIVGRNIKFLSKRELDNVRLEYGEIVNSSEISNRDEIGDVWNKSDDGKGPKQNAENMTKFCSLVMREG